MSIVFVLTLIASGLLVVDTKTACSEVGRCASAQPPNCRKEAAWVIPPSEVAQTRSCSYAYAVAAARDDTSSFVKMLLTCRSTVRSLTTSFAAIPLLVSPAATRRRT
jgi:hypothetical protein